MPTVSPLATVTSSSAPRERCPAASEIRRSDRARPATEWCWECSCAPRRVDNVAQAVAQEIEAKHRQHQRGTREERNPPFARDHKAAPSATTTSSPVGLQGRAHSSNLRCGSSSRQCVIAVRSCSGPRSSACALDRPGTARRQNRGHANRPVALSPPIAAYSRQRSWLTCGARAHPGYSPANPWCMAAEENPRT